MSAADLDQRGLPRGYPYRPDWEITPREVRERVREAGGAEDAGFVLVDCRRVDEHALCKVEGALLIPLDELERRADELEDDAGGRDRLVVIYCHTGRRSLRAATTLRAMGFERAVSMAGGIDLWSVDIDPKVPRY